MKKLSVIILLILFSGLLKAQEADTFFLHHALSKYDTIIYKRIIQFDKNKNLYNVRDYFENGQIQMQGTYSSLNKNIKENYWCNYNNNTKQGLYQTWYKNGQLEFRGNFKDGKFHGLFEEWYPNGQISVRSDKIQGNIQGNSKGQTHGAFTSWIEDGRLKKKTYFKNGLNINPVDTNYHYLSYKPDEYEQDTSKMWPLIIYLHGGSRRGTDLNKLYASGIPDQIYRGRKFPFIIVAPQCPQNLRWSTDNWFENFYKEITTKYRVDTNRVYLTGVSLGGAGTWFLAVKYPDKFAAIAPMSGFTSHIDYIDKNIDKLIDIPIWAFHGKIDKVVQIEETERIIKRLKGKNKNLKFTVEPDVGHWIDWLIYPNQELFDWFLKYKNNTP
ncbi:prolyl oligopeptidase family serine peptidase [Bacteroidota bacterium]